MKIWKVGREKLNPKMVLFICVHLTILLKAPLGAGAFEAGRRV